MISGVKFLLTPKRVPRFSVLLVKYPLKILLPSKINGKSHQELTAIHPIKNRLIKDRLNKTLSLLKLLTNNHQKKKRNKTTQYVIKKVTTPKALEKITNDKTKGIM